MNKEYYIKLQATIDDSQKTVSELNSKIKTLESKVSELKLKVDSQKVSKANKQLKSLNDTAKEGKKQADKWNKSTYYKTNNKCITPRLAKLGLNEPRQKEQTQKWQDKNYKICHFFVL